MKKNNHPVHAAFSHASQALKSLQHVATASVSPRATTPRVATASNNNSNRSSSSNNNSSSNDIPMWEHKPPLWYAALALSLTAPDWHELGLDAATQPPLLEDNNNNNNNNDNNNDNNNNDNNNNDNNNNDNNHHPNNSTNSTLPVLVDRMTALLLVRVVAVAMARESTITTPPSAPVSVARSTTTSTTMDYSTSTICRTALLNHHSSNNNNTTTTTTDNDNDTTDSDCWSRWGITATVVQQIHQFVYRMVTQYAERKQVPYHNQQHAYHVTLSTNKLIDALWHGAATAAPPAGTSTSTTPSTSTSTTKGKGASFLPKSFGLRGDPLALAAVLFSAIIHDVQHQGRIIVLVGWLVGLLVGLLVGR